MLCIIIISSSFRITNSRQLHDDFILVKGLECEVMGLDIHRFQLDFALEKMYCVFEPWEVSM